MKPHQIFYDLDMHNKNYGSWPEEFDELDMILSRSNMPRAKKNQWLNMDDLTPGLITPPTSASTHQMMITETHRTLQPRNGFLIPVAVESTRQIHLPLIDDRWEEVCAQRFEDNCTAIQPVQVSRIERTINHGLRGRRLNLKYSHMTMARVTFAYEPCLPDEMSGGTVEGELVISELIPVDQGVDFGRAQYARNLMRVRRAHKKARAAAHAVPRELQDDSLDVLTVKSLGGEVTGYETLRNRDDHPVNQGHRMSGWAQWRQPASKRLSLAAQEAQRIRMEEQGVESTLERQERLERIRVERIRVEQSVARMKKLLGVK